MANVIRFRLYKFEKKLNEAQPHALPTYQCQKCGREFSVYDVEALLDPMTEKLRCPRCHGDITQVEDTEKKNEFAEQKRQILESLKPMQTKLKETETYAPPKVDLSILEESVEETDSGVSNVQITEKEAKPEVVFDQVPTKKPQAPLPWGGSQLNPSESPSQTRNRPFTVPENNEGIKVDDSAMNAYNEYVKKSKVEAEPVIPIESQDAPPAPAEVTLVAVGDRMVPIDQVTEEDKEQMTDDQYDEYFRLLND